VTMMVDADVELLRRQVYGSGRQVPPGFGSNQS
jgi:hypothetical protein